MIVLYVILAILLLLVLLFSCSITLYVQLTDSLQVQVGIAGLRWRLTADQKDKLLAGPEKQKKKKSKKKKKTKAKTKTQKKTTQTDKKTPSFGELITLLLDWVRALSSPAGMALRHLRIEKLRIHMRVGREDAAQTARDYALISGGLYQLLGFLSAHIKVDIRQLHIEPDYVRGENSQQVSFRLKLRGHILLWSSMRILGGIMGKIGNDTPQTKKPQRKTPQGASVK